MKKILVAVGMLAALPVLASESGRFTETRIDSSLEEMVLERCEIEPFEDWVACPKGEKYQFDAFSVELVKNFLNEQYDLTVTKATPTSAAKLIRGSMAEQARYAREGETYFTGRELESFRLVMEAYESFAGTFASAVRSAGKDRLVFVDPDAYWDISVNARGVAIVDTKKKTVTVILHGDTDG